MVSVKKADQITDPAILKPGDRFKYLGLKMLCVENKGAIIAHYVDKHGELQDWTFFPNGLDALRKEMSR